MKEYAARNPEKIWLYKRAYELQSKYGITVEQYAGLFESQGGSCAICGFSWQFGSRLLHVDHDHATGKIRGLLCDGCNHTLGLLLDSPTLCEIAGAYLEAASSQ